MTTQMTDEKSRIRQEMRLRRKQLEPSVQEEAAKRACAHLTAFAPYRAAQCVMAYAACRGELSLDSLIREILAAGKTLAMPRCEAPGVMTARRIERLDQMEEGAYGLMEPREDCAVIPPEAIGLILVPGTAFSRAGGRVGQGGGYYDRFLEQTEALRMGVCHGFALMDDVPGERHDQHMNCILTPEGIILCGREHEKKQEAHT